MSRGNMLLGYARGRVGSMVFGRRMGEQTTRSYNSQPHNPKTIRQMLQRTKMPNIVNFYRDSRYVIKKSFETRRNVWSNFNAFVNANLASSDIRIYRAMADAGAYVVAPYMISKGTLPSIDINFFVPTGANLTVFASNIAVEATPGAADTWRTVSDLTLDVLRNNDNIMEGDKLTFLRYYSYPEPLITSGAVKTELVYIDVAMNTQDLTELSEIDPNGLVFSVMSNPSAGPNVLGYMDSRRQNIGFAIIHSRIDANLNLLTSTQMLVLSQPMDIYDQFSSADMAKIVLNEYGYNPDVILDPRGGTSSSNEEAQSSVNINAFYVKSPNNGVYINYLSSSSLSAYRVQAGTILRVQGEQLSASNIIVEMTNSTTQEVSTYPFNYFGTPTETPTRITVTIAAEHPSVNNFISAMFVQRSSDLQPELVKRWHVHQDNEQGELNRLVGNYSPEHYNIYDEYLKEAPVKRTRKKTTDTTENDNEDEIDELREEINDDLDDVQRLRDAAAKNRKRNTK